MLAALAAFLTWPQALHLTSQFAWHTDPHFSVWRLAWIAHALTTDPRHLFDANVFFPAARTLAYSDATLLEGGLAAPLFWIGVPPVLVYNLALFAGFIGSGVAMFVLTHHLTDSRGAALVGAAIFMMVPYRIEHFAHLELQWAMFIPLTFWAIHRTVEGGSWRFGALAGVFVALQTLACVYYGVFLMMTLPVLTGLLLAFRRDRIALAAGPLVVGAAVAFVTLLPYARVYIETAHELGGRNVQEIVRYSARPMSYLASPSQNWIWGWTGDRFGDAELRLFPGLVAVALGVVGLAGKPRAMALVYAAIALFAVEMSFGLNGVAYRWLYEHLSALGGLRAAARWAIVAYSALAVLVSLGVARLESRVRDGFRRQALVAAVVLLVSVEYASAPLPLTAASLTPRSVYTTISSLGPGVVLELPAPRASRLPGYDGIYSFWSTTHWHPLINGYSGYYPIEYIRTIEALRTFPDSASILRLRHLGVRYIVVHRALFPRDEYTALETRMLARPELSADGRFEDPLDAADLFELRP